MIHEGHRQRMLARLAQGDNLQEHELLEIILFNAIPRKNTNEIAHALLNTFGNLKSVFHADMQKLTTVEGVGVNVAGFLISLGAVMDKITESRENDLPSAYSYESFSQYLETRFQSAQQEYIELYSVKKNGKVEFCQRYTSDENDHARISRVEIAKFVAAFEPKQVILVHNHCSNNHSPSAADDAFTKDMCLCFTMFGVDLLDHFIVSWRGTYSYHMERQIDQIRIAAQKIAKGAFL